MTSSHVRRLRSRVERTADRMVDHATRNDLSVADLRDAKLPWYEIRDAEQDSGVDAGEATILLFDEIGGSFGVDAKTFVTALESITAPTIKLRINSPGGALFEAVAIYNALIHHQSRIVVYVDALAASAASVIAMAGDEVVMMPGSQMMIHDAGMVEDGNAEDMRKAAVFLDRQSDNMADLYRRRAGGQVRQWRKAMLDETWMFADEAVAAGLADRVADPPAAARDQRMTRSFDLSQFRYEGRESAPAPELRAGVEDLVEARGTAPARPAQQQTGRRFGHLSRVEVRARDDGGVHVEGHAAVFDIPTWIGPDDHRGFEEVIASGAFKKTISDGADVRFLFNHNADLVLARTKATTLTLSEDTVGLAVSADLAPTSVGRDLAILLDRGDVDQMSFGFQVIRDRWETVRRDDGTEYERRAILEARLFDVSATTYPAYDETDLAIREATLARELRDARTGRRTPGEPAPATPPDDPPPSTTRTTDPAESGVFSCPEPPPAGTPVNGVADRSLRPLDLIVRHAAGDHTGSPRMLCPACTRLEPAPATPAAQ